MSHYFIAIGGTGAKCLEAFCHVCGAGLGPRDAYLMCVDPDRANGSVERAKLAARAYVDCRQALRPEGVQLCSTDFRLAEPLVWSPFEGTHNPTLQDFLHYDAAKQDDRPVADLLDVLFSRVELETNLDKGFRGHPSIGAAVLTNTVKLYDSEPWATFRELLLHDIKTGQHPRVFLVGSIFGGTGAAGFPTIARLIKRELLELGIEEGKLGGALILPYFSLPSSSTKPGELQAVSENFLLGTEAALRYYRRQWDTEAPFDSLYLVGDEALAPVKFHSVGSKSQCNDPHFVELFAALAACDFFAEGREVDVAVIGRKTIGQLEWTDLPDVSGKRKTAAAIAGLTTFAFSYCELFYPALVDIKREGKSYRAPWCVDLLDRRHVHLTDDVTWGALGRVREYCLTFLKWLAGVQVSSKDVQVRLAAYTAFSELVDAATSEDHSAVRIREKFVARDFPGLTVSSVPRSASCLGDVWERVSSSGNDRSSLEGVPGFVMALYAACEHS